MRARKFAPNKRFTSTSGVAVAAALEAFIVDLLTASAEVADHEGRKRLHCEDVIVALDLSECGRVVTAPIVNSVAHVRGVARTVALPETAMDEIRSKYQAKARERLAVSEAKAKVAKKVKKVKKVKVANNEDADDEVTTGCGASGASGEAASEEEDEEEVDDEDYD